MIHYLLDTYDGPLVLSQRIDSWVIAAPCRALEVFSGTIPPDCLANARRISTNDAVSILGDCSVPLWSDDEIRGPLDASTIQNHVISKPDFSPCRILHEPGAGAARPVRRVSRRRFRPFML